MSAVAWGLATGGAVVAALAAVADGALLSEPPVSAIPAERSALAPPAPVVPRPVPSRERTHRALAFARVLGHLAAGSGIAVGLGLSGRATLSTVALLVGLGLAVVLAAETTARVIGDALGEDAEERLAWFSNGAEKLFAPVVRLDVAVTASRLDGDAWVAALQKYAEGGVRPVLPVGLDISAEAATLAGGTLRALRGAVDIAGGTVSMREARAVLPGDAALLVSGRLVAGRRFEGEAQLDAPALRTTLVWAAGAWAAGAGMGPVDSLPPGVLQRGVLAGKMVLDDRQLVLSEVTGTVDGAGVAASLSWRQGQGAVARPALRAMVALQRLELDPWLAAFGHVPARLAACCGSGWPTRT